MLRNLVPPFLSLFSMTFVLPPTICLVSWIPLWGHFYLSITSARQRGWGSVEPIGFLHHRYTLRVYADTNTDTNTHLNIFAYSDTDIETGKKTHSDTNTFDIPIPILPIRWYRYANNHTDNTPYQYRFNTSLGGLYLC